ncbi:MAG: hypothetical protein LBL65_02685 [Campylobacteraceae bacterium]|jgi:hypothetical protein|nr:hypothetical protein [Campylobacteraceae bacterium]
MSIFFGNRSLTLFKLLSLSLLFGFLLIGCGSGGGSDNPPPNPTNTHFYQISFLNGDLEVAYTVSKQSGNVNISAVADEGGLTGPIYAANDVLVRGNLEYEAYNLTQDISFYTVAGIKEISSQEGLNAIRTGLNGRYILTDDIDLDPDGAGFDANGWQKIGAGNNAANRFSGRLNGNGHTISGLWINIASGGDDYFGLFSYITNAHIENLNIEIPAGKAIRGNDNHVGAVAGYATGSTILNVHVTGNITAADNYAGGIVGQIAGTSTITNSCFEGSVNGDQYVGGIVGYAEGASIVKNSCFTGIVIGLDSDVGGIAGYITGAGSSIKNSYSSGIVGGVGGNVGGIAGQVRTGSSVLNSYSNADVISYGANTGGIAGYTYSSSASVKNSYSLGTVNGTTYVGGIVGRIYTNNAAVQKNAAVNPSVIGSGNNYKNRVVSGYVGGVSNNFALDTMSGSFTQGTNAANHGTSKTAAELATQETYSEGLGWAFGNDDDNPWVWSAYGSYLYPTLYWETN